MMNFFLFYTLIATAQAQSCPTINGIFKCQGSGNSYQIQVSTDVDDQTGAPRYHFQGPAQGGTEVIADGQERALATKTQHGSVRGDCQAERLIAYFNLLDESGHTTVFKDEMYMERKALVRIRFMGPTASTFVCRPVFAHPE